MGDPGGDWDTIFPTSQSGMERLCQSQLEEVERHILREWESSKSHWSGVGKHVPVDDRAEAKKLHARFRTVGDGPLGAGTYGIVEKVQFLNHNRSICLARKQVFSRRGDSIQARCKEANVMEKLDHEHIVKLVGTYAYRSSLYILVWPVAVCHLENLITDIDNLRKGEGFREDIISRLHALDLRDLSRIERPRSVGQASDSHGNCPLVYLRQIMGCITRAVAYCHQANIRHLDLKPRNILLNPGRVYLADFGISQDVHGLENTLACDVQGTPKWRAPEIAHAIHDWSMKAADIYSLGMVLLNIATVIHGAPLDEFDRMLGDVSEAGRTEKLQAFLHKLEAMALATQEVDDVNAPTFGPKHVVNLVSKMVASDPSSRPVVFQVDSELVELGGIDQVYHSQCCKKSRRFVTERINTKFKLVAGERDRLRAEHEAMAKRLQILEAKDTTYEQRILNERRAHAENIAKLQAQLEKEREQRQMLEARVTQMQPQSRKPARPGILPRASDRQAPCARPSSGLTMGPRLRADPSPSTSQQRPPLSQAQQRNPAPVAGYNTRPTYSQTAAAAIAPQTATLAAARRDSLIPSPSPSPSPVAVPINNSPTPEIAGFPLRSRNSGSRLPRAVVPTTPIRSNTPTHNRDPSSAESTQYSMSSSVFSRLSLSKASLAESSVTSTPPLSAPAAASVVKDSGAVMDMRRKGTPPVVPVPTWGAFAEPGGAGQISSSPVAEHGLGLGMTDPDRERRESFASEREERESVRDTASVASSAVVMPGTASPVLTSASTVSSPRAAHASVEGGRVGAVRVPPLPTAKSWADVARRERRG